ncbi:MAG: antitoxin Xre-like helix-turn-helix domain-containing protein [Trueperaceae bacterium]
MPNAEALPGTGTWSPQAGSQYVGLGTRTLARLLRSKDVSLASASRRIEEGLPFRLFSELAGQLGITHASLAGYLRISESTLYRRKAAGRFDPTESDRLWRYLVLYGRAVDVLESQAAAVEWLSAPLPSLGDASPLAVARDGPGATRALAVLGRIEHGVFG